jgi:hypothetical protein
MNVIGFLVTNKNSVLVLMKVRLGRRIYETIKKAISR